MQVLLTTGCISYENGLIYNINVHTSPPACLASLLPVTCHAPAAAMLAQDQLHRARTNDTAAPANYVTIDTTHTHILPRLVPPQSRQREPRPHTPAHSVESLQCQRQQPLRRMLCPRQPRARALQSAHLHPFV